MCNTWRNVFLQSMKTNTLKCEEVNKEFDSQNPTTIVRGVWNHHSYTVGHATTKSWKSSIWVFPQFFFEIPQLFMFFNFALSSLFPSFFFIGNINIWVYVLYNIHLWLILQVAFSAKWMWLEPSPSMLNSTQYAHSFMFLLFETRSKSSQWPCQLKNLRTKH